MGAPARCQLRLAAAAGAVAEPIAVGWGVESATQGELLHALSHSAAAVAATAAAGGKGEVKAAAWSLVARGAAAAGLEAS